MPSSRRGFLGGLIGGAAALVVAPKTVTVEVDGRKIAEKSLEHAPKYLKMVYGQCGCPRGSVNFRFDVEGLAMCEDCHLPLNFSSLGK